MSGTAWGVLLVVSSLLTLGAGVGTVLAVASIWQARRDARAVEAAERFAAVNLTAIVKRYVPAEHQTNVAHEEIALAKPAIVARRARLKWKAVVFSVILVCSAVATVSSAYLSSETATAMRLATTPRHNLDVLKVIQGVWGWRADFLGSCSENPQTIQVAPDRKTLTLQYAKPFRLGSETIALATFTIVSAQQNMLVMTWADPPKPLMHATFDVQFIDANTMSWSLSNSAEQSSGAIERCTLTRQ